MKRFKKTSIFRQLRILSLKHMIVPTIMSITAILFLTYINFDGIFNPVTYQNSFDAYSAYTDGTDNIHLHLGELKYTGYNIMKGNKVKYVYFYELSGDKCMFYKLDMNYDSVADIPRVLTDVEISAKVMKTDGITKNMMESFAQSINWNLEGLESVCFPVYVNEHEYNPTIYYIFYIMLASIVFYSLYPLTSNLFIVIAPHTHPAYRRIRVYYPDMKYDELVDMINDNFQNNVLVTAGKMYVTDLFFINLGPREVSIIPLDQIVLAYDHGQLLKFLGIHIRMSHTLHFRGYKKVKILASGKKATHTTIITDYIRDKYPTIIWGHTKENILAYQQILATERANE